MAIPSTNSLTSGSRVKLHSLQRAQHLNDRIGTILRSPTNPTNRYAVYLTNPTSSIGVIPKNLIISVLPKNLSALPYPQFPSKISPTRHALKLNAFILASLKGVGFHHLFYPFGNTAPVYIFPGIERDAKEVRVLLLASGDLRSPFYSLSRDTPARLERERKVHFFVNDIAPEIIARNVVILWLIHRRSATVETIFSIWFSLRIPTTAYCILVDAVLALTGPNADDEIKEINVSFHERGDWQTVKGILKSWISWQDELPWDVVSNMRRRAILEYAGQSLESLAESAAKLLTILYSGVAGDRQFPIKAGREELKQYIHTGVVQAAEELEYTNPTLFQQPDQYSLHYGSDPFSAFPRFAKNYDTKKPCLSHCMQQMNQWMGNLHEHGNNVSWTFSTADCMNLCTQLSGPFDVVSTSNVSDHVGLMPLLQALRGITTPSGTLITQSLRFSSYSTSIEEYLQSHLIVAPEFYDSMLGWRCVGHDGNLTPPNGNVLFSVPSLTEIILSNMAKQDNGYGCRCELSLIWKPSRIANVPLRLLDNGNAKKLVEAFLPEVVSLPYANDKVCKTRPSWSHRISLTILPVLLSAEGSDELLLKEDNNAIELRDLALWIMEEKLGEMNIATVEVSHEDLCIFFRAWKGFSPLLVLNVIIVRGNRSLPYCGLSGEFKASTKTWLLSWLIHRDRLGPQDRIYLHAFCSTIKSFSFQDVAFKEPNLEDYCIWLRRVSCKRDGNFCRGRSEDANTFTVPIKISDAWMTALNAKRTLRAIVTGHTGSITVGVEKQLTDPVVIDLPGPIVASGTKLMISRKQREVKCVVKRGKYKISSLLLADSWIEDDNTWMPMKKENEAFLITASGMQMNDEERYISRTRDITPPLIAVKDTFMFFFQCYEESYMALSFRGHRSSATDVRAVIAHHGLRQEHRTGVPAADLSICFLENSFLREMIPWLQKLEIHRHIYCTPEDFELLKEYFDLFSSRCKDRSSWKDEPLKASIQDKAIRRRFKRLLVQPLFSPSLVSSFFKLTGRLEGASNENSAQDLKKTGTKLCKDGNYKEAIIVFRRAVVQLTKETGLDKELSKDSKKLMAQCLLNVAFCTLQEGDVRNPEETIISCDRALEHINPHNDKLIAKARFRKGLALEMLGKLSEAFIEVSAAMRCSNEKAVRDVFQRVRDNLKEEQ